MLPGHRFDISPDVLIFRLRILKRRSDKNSDMSQVSHVPHACESQFHMCVMKSPDALEC